MSCNTVIQRRSSVVITRPECGQSVIVRPTVSRTVVVSQPPAQNTVVLRGVRGLPGLDVELQKTATHIQWRVHKAGEPWADLVALSEITGPASFADAPSDGTPYARKDGAWTGAATAAQGTAADNALPKAGGTMTGAITFAGGQTWPTFNQSTTGNAATATKLATARTIGGVSFDGTANISLPGVNTAGTQNTTGSAAKWTTARTITLGATGKSVDGSAAVTWTLAEIGAAPVNATLTDAAAASTLPATTSTALTALLQTVRDCLKWLLANTLQLSGNQTAAGVKTFSSRSVHAGAYTPSLTPAHSATPTFDCSAGNVFEPAAMTGNVTSITLSNAVAGQTVQIRFQQDATGGRTCAVPSGAKVDGAINTGANRVSWLILTYSGRASRFEGNWLVVPT